MLIVILFRIETEESIDCHRIITDKNEGLYFQGNKTRYLGLRGWTLNNSFHFLFLALNESTFEMVKGLNETGEETKTTTSLPLVVRPRPFGSFYPFSNATPFKGNVRTTTISTTNLIKDTISSDPTASSKKKSCRIIRINFYFKAICAPKSQTYSSEDKTWSKNFLFL